ncbi:MAG TPA: dienelactone hydrolase family protein, partial [Quisquiliibacterium sp.]|nr:dienelactone hydrolase family protein [Quisquiliibacterium sp.]
MIEHHIDIPTPEGAMNTFFVHPDEGGPHPVVLFYMDAPGKREELHDMARRIASVGYCVVLPNLYYRRTREFVMERTEEGFARMFAMMDHIDNMAIVRDTAALLEFVNGRP